MIGKNVVDRLADPRVVLYGYVTRFKHPEEMAMGGKGLQRFTPCEGPCMTHYQPLCVGGRR